MATLPRVSGIAVAMLTLVLVAMIADLADSRLGTRSSAFDLVVGRTTLRFACRWQTTSRHWLSTLPMSRHALSRNFYAHGFPVDPCPLINYSRASSPLLFTCLFLSLSISISISLYLALYLSHSCTLPSLSESTCRFQRVRVYWLSRETTHDNELLHDCRRSGRWYVSETYARTFHART